MVTSLNVFLLPLIQRSLISYKSKMVMRSIPELLNDSSSHISIAVPRNLKESSPMPSSSSDSNEDIDELPFIPMPLNMEFSGSRMSLNDIQTTEQQTGKQDGTSTLSGSPVQGQEAMECNTKEMDKEGVEITGKGRLRKRSPKDNDKGSSDEESPAELPQKSQVNRKPLRRGSSMDSDKSDKPEGGRRRGELRRGGSADSALLLKITPEEGTGEGIQEDGRRVLKKAVSMELPRRSTSPGTANMSQEDYALKLEMMRQRLLRGGSVDKKMSGLRGPLLETLGSSDRYSRTARVGPPPLIRASSSDSAMEDDPKPKMLRKTASFSQGDSEPIALHRRLGAPLEIPLAQVEERRLKEAISMSSLTEQIKLDSRPVTPRDPSPKPPTPESVVQESPIKAEREESFMEKEIKPDDNMNEKMEGMTTDSNFDERSSTSGFSEKDMSISEETMIESEYTGQIIATPPVVVQSSTLEEKMEEEVVREDVQEEKEEMMKEEEIIVGTVKGNVEEKNMPAQSSDMIITTSSVIVRPTQEYSHPSAMVLPTSVPSSVPVVTLPGGRTSAYASIMQTIMVPAVQPLNDQPLSPSTPIVDPAIMSPSVSSVPTYSPASMSSALPGQPKLVIISTTEHPAVFSRVASPEMMTKEPTPPRTTTHPSSQQETPAGVDFKDISSEEVFEARFKKRESSLSRSLKFLSRSKEDKSQAMSSDSAESGEEIYRPGPIGAPLELAPRRLEEKCKSVQDLREAQKDQGFMKRLSMRLKRAPSAERKEEATKEEDPSRRRLSWTIGRRGSQEKKEVEMAHKDSEGNVLSEKDDKELKKPNESPVLAMRRKIESTVAGISTRIRSFSEERKASEDKEPKRTPIFSMLRRATSESRAPKVTSVPQNQLAAQASNGASSESLDSMVSLKSETKGMKQSYTSLFGNVFVFSCIINCTFLNT